MRDPRHVEGADVLIGDTPAATLRRRDGGIDFTYRAEHLAANGRAVATSLPLTDEPVRTLGGALPPFFSGLLPEGRRLSGLRAAVKTSADDELSLLLAVGEDPVGDVRVVPEGTDPESLSAGGGVETGHPTWEDMDFGDLLATSGIDPSALAGVQDKVSGRMLTLPLVHGGRCHLLKLDPPEYPHVVENEAFFLDLARGLRHPVVRSEVVHDRHGRSGLLVTRFDRHVVDGAIHRSAVEDGAQLLGRYPADKYTVTTEHLIRRIGEVAPARLPAVRAVLQQVALAWLTGNGDLHAKNVSVVRDAGEWRVAPIYDIPSTLPYGDHRLALRIGGRDDSLSRKRWLALAEEVGLAPRAAERALDDVLTVTSDVADRAVDAIPMTPRAARDVRRVLRRRHDLMT
ncbi:MAG: HipA domain-containing protein [Mobilicoccus sp.]|nr:HipA domain-containing protein [Mobilicoccus sp.]